MARIIVILVVVLISGCASVEERYSTANVRHPCGNIWDICRGDSAVLDKIRTVLEGTN